MPRPRVVLGVGAFFVFLFMLTWSSPPPADDHHHEQSTIAAKPAPRSSSVFTPSNAQRRDEPTVLVEEKSKILTSRPSNSNSGSSSRYVTPWIPDNACFAPLKLLRRGAFILYRLISKKRTVEAKIYTSVRSVLNEMCTSMHSAGVKPVVVDIGANDGEDLPLWFEGFDSSDSPCHKAGVSFKVFEPQDRYAALLDGIIRKHETGRDIALVHAAVGPEDRHGDTVVMTGSGEQGTINLKNDGNAGKKRSGAAESHVRLASLSEILKGNYSTLEQATLFSPRGKDALKEAARTQSDVLMLKVDCEGADAMILRNNERLFAEGRVHFVMWEIHRRALKRFGIRTADAVDMMKKHGYNTYILGIKPHEKELVLMDMDEQLSANWPPELETGIALSPTAQKFFMERADSGPSSWERLRTRKIEQAFHPEVCPFRKLQGKSMTDADVGSWFARMGIPRKKSCLGAMHTIPCPECGGEKPIYH